MSHLITYFNFTLMACYITLNDHTHNICICCVVNNIGASLNHKALHEAGITNVINWSSTARCNVFADMEYMCIKGIRGEPTMQEHTDELEKAVEYVESVRLAGGKAMSHCWYGKNRR